MPSYCSESSPTDIDCRVECLPLQLRHKITAFHTLFSHGAQGAKTKALNPAIPPNYRDWNSEMRQVIVIGFMVTPRHGKKHSFRPDRVICGGP